jgi:hypothetical protein
MYFRMKRTPVLGGGRFWLVTFSVPDKGDVFVLLEAESEIPQPVLAGQWID